MLKYKNFGRKSLIELNQILSNLGLVVRHGSRQDHGY